MVIIFSLLTAVVCLAGVLVVSGLGYGAYRWLGPTAAWVAAGLLGVGVVGMAIHALQAYFSARNADERVVMTIFAVGVAVPALIALVAAVWFVRLATRP